MGLFVIGDIHGHLNALRKLIDSIEPKKKDLLIFTGDYVEKGPDSSGVLDYLIQLRKNHRCIFLRGNHDQAYLEAGLGHKKHLRFLAEKCHDFHETKNFIFVHGGIRAHKDPADEKIDYLQSATLSKAEPHHSGRTVICGHSAQSSGKIADLGHTICIDTAISKGQFLTCLNVKSMRFWQADQTGKVSKKCLLREKSQA